MRLGTVLRRWRLMEERDLRSVGKEIGISASTLLRVESGRDPSGATLAAIIRWLTKGGRPAGRGNSMITGQPYIANQPEIADRCPACGGKMFIGAGGWITCTLIGCKRPALEQSVGDLRARVAELEEALRMTYSNCLELIALREHGPDAAADDRRIRIIRDRAQRALADALPPEHRPIAAIDDMRKGGAA